MFYVVPNHEFAEVNKDGQVRSSLTKYIYKPFVDRDGYLRCKIWDGEKLRGILVHRAVAIVFIPNPENKPCVNHKDSNRQNNSISNLEWVTPRENAEHAKEFGFLGRGDNSPVSVYSEEEIHEVCQLLEDGYPTSEVSQISGVNKSVVNSVVRRHSWLHISEKYSVPFPKKKMSEEVAKEILILLREGWNYSEIVERYKHLGINRHHVGNLKLGKTFKHLER